MRTPFSPCGKGVGSAPRRQGKTGGSEKTTLLEAPLEFCSRKAVRMGVGPAHATELCRPQGDAPSVGRPAGWIEARNAVDATVEFGGLDGRMQWLRWPNAVDSIAECSGCDRQIQACHRRIHRMRRLHAVDAMVRSRAATGESTGCDPRIEGCNRTIHPVRRFHPRGSAPRPGPRPFQEKGDTPKKYRFLGPFWFIVASRPHGAIGRPGFDAVLLALEGVVFSRRNPIFLCGRRTDDPWWIFPADAFR